ncbi:MAG: aldo/keto reductase [Ruminococcus sp.]|nr:aldo/keto reductase [Ruminococcus sp.]
MYSPNPNRYDKMKYRRCGSSGLLLPIVSFGLWHNFGENSTESDMKKLCFTAFDNGITHFDLANNYGPPAGAAEKAFGKIIKTHFSCHRDELIISTKAGYDMWEGPYGIGGSKKYLLSSLDQSLLRLGIPYVDIFYHHCPDPDTPLEETMGALAQAVHSGKALYAGLSNYDGETMKKACDILDKLHCPFIINQNRCSMLDTTIEKNGLLKACKERKKGLILFSPLEQGLLTNRYLNGIPDNSRVRTDRRFLTEKNITPQKIEIVKKLNDIALKRGQSLAQMALCWLLKNETVTSVIVGASHYEQLLDSLKILDAEPFSGDELNEIKNILQAESA